jgi:hypothetical protein
MRFKIANIPTFAASRGETLNLFNPARNFAALAQEVAAYKGLDYDSLVIRELSWAAVVAQQHDRRSRDYFS